MRSIKSKVKSGYILFTITILIFIIVLNIAYFKKLNVIRDLNQKLYQAYNNQITAFHNAEKLFQYETKNPRFYITEGSPLLVKHQKETGKVIRKLSSIHSKSKDLNANLHMSIDSILLHSFKHSEILDNLVELIYIRGYKDYGMVGKMRDEIHLLEKIAPKYKSNILTLRRHEKDYIIRNEQSYIDKLNTKAHILKSIVKLDNELPENKKDTIIHHLKNYTAYFNRIVKLDDSIGIRSNKKLKLQLEKESQTIHQYFSHLMVETEKFSENARKKLIFALLTIGFFVIIGILITSFCLIRRITAPLSLITNNISEFVKNDFSLKKESQLAKSRDLEVHTILKEFRVMLTQLEKRKEQKDEAMRELAENEKHYRELADLLPLGIFETDLEGRIMYANHSLLNLNKIDLKTISKGIYLYDILKNTNNEFSLKKEHKNKEMTLIDTEGTEIPVLLNIVQSRKYGKNIGYRGAIIDITERKKYVEALKLEKLKAQEADKLKSAFLANMSHEIRTPLNAIIGFSELLSTRENLNISEQRMFINHIKNSGELLLNLINDIIDIAKIEAGELKINKNTTSISAIISEIHLIFRDQIQRKEKNIELKINTPGNDIVLETDSFRLKQVLTNLMSNAIKFTEEGFVEIGYYYHSTDHLLFYVQDSGIGIDDAKQKFIFERFRQVEESHGRNYNGAGLGLAITKNIIELLGGTIWVNSKVNAGSIFMFTLPFKQTNHIPGRVAKYRKATISGMPKQSLSNATILIAEDNYSNYIYLKELIMDHGARIIKARNGNEVIHLLKTKCIPDLILMDMSMPVKDGFETSAEVKSLWPQIPILAVTAHAMSGDEEQCRMAGCNDYISKPVNPGLLFAKITKIITDKKKIMN